MILWGLYGDLLVEKFSIAKIFRSLGLGVSWSLVLFFVNSDLPLFIVALSVITLERITTEIYKALIRVEDQEKYKIPSDLSIKMDGRLRQFSGLSLILVLVLAICFGELPLDKMYISIIIGLFAALTGAMKDAPYEGFSLLTFFRSPVIAVGLGILLSMLFPAISGKFLLLAIAGGERIISEFYKKIFRGRIPGKFKKIAVNQDWEVERKWLLIPYVTSISGIVLLVLI